MERDYSWSFVPFQAGLVMGRLSGPGRSENCDGPGRAGPLKIENVRGWAGQRAGPEKIEDVMGWAGPRPIL